MIPNNPSCSFHKDTPLDESRLQLAAFIVHRPPRAIAKHLAANYVAEHKATLGVRYDQQSNHSIKAAASANVHV